MPAAWASRRIAVTDLVVDARTYQFKGGGDAQGVTDRLAAVTAWDPLAGATNPLLLHRRDRLYVVDGHQRVGLARRLDIRQLTAIVLDSATYTIPEARRIGARLNLQHGTGSAIDIAKMLRLDPLSPAERATMPLDTVSGDLLRTGEALAALGDEAFLRVVNGQVHPQPKKNAAYGAIIGRLVEGDVEQVEALCRLADVAPDGEYQAEQFVRAILADGFDRHQQVGLFGEVTVAASLAAPIAQVLAAAHRRLVTERSAFAGVVRHDARLTARGNTLNPLENRAAVASAAALEAWLTATSHHVGPLRTELRRVAAAVDAGTLTVAAAVDAVLAVIVEVRGDRLDARTPRLTVARPVGPAPVAPTGVVSVWAASLPDPGLTRDQRRKPWAVYPEDFLQSADRIGGHCARYLRQVGRTTSAREVEWLVAHARAAWSVALHETGLREAA